MPLIIFPILSGIVGYLAGSINWAIHVGHWSGVEIRTLGNGNPGAANLYRSVGHVQGVSAFVADVLTGASVVILAGLLPFPDISRLAASVMILVGTAYPIFWGFVGGTGLAKGMGAAMAINPLGFLVGAIVGFPVLRKLHNTGWSGAVTMVITMLCSMFFYGDEAGAGTIALIAMMVIARSKLQYRST